MIRKSGHRFSDKIVLHYGKRGAQSIQLETLALKLCASAISHDRHGPCKHATAARIAAIMAPVSA